MESRGNRAVNESLWPFRFYIERNRKSVCFIDITIYCERLQRVFEAFIFVVLCDVFNAFLTYAVLVLIVVESK